MKKRKKFYPPFSQNFAGEKMIKNDPNYQFDWCNISSPVEIQIEVIKRIFGSKAANFQELSPTFARLGGEAPRELAITKRLEWPKRSMLEIPGALFKNETGNRLRRNYIFHADELAGDPETNRFSRLDYCRDFYGFETTDIIPADKWLNLEKYFSPAFESKVYGLHSLTLVHAQMKFRLYSRHRRLEYLAKRGKLTAADSEWLAKFREVSCSRVELELRGHFTKKAQTILRDFSLTDAQQANACASGFLRSNRPKSSIND
jgi:hypothetical protein